MDRVNVESSSIKSIGYDKEKLILEVEFVKKPKESKNTEGSIYQYQGFTNQDYTDLFMATVTSSIGSYFSKRIAKKFKYERVN